MRQELKALATATALLSFLLPLPAASQRCASLSYSRANAEACQRAAEALDPETRARARALLREAIAQRD